MSVLELFVDCLGWQIYERKRSVFLMAIQLLDFVFCGFRVLGVRVVCCGVLFRGMSFLRVLRWFCTGWSGNFLQSMKSFSDAVVRSGGVQCGSSRGGSVFRAGHRGVERPILFLRWFLLCASLALFRVVAWD